METYDLILAERGLRIAAHRFVLAKVRERQSGLLNEVEDEPIGPARDDLAREFSELTRIERFLDTGGEILARRRAEQRFETRALTRTARDPRHGGSERG